MRSVRAVAAITLTAGLIGPPAGPVSAGHDATEYFDLGKLPGTDFNGKQIFQGLKDFVADYPYRLTGTPMEIAAGQHLHSEMEALGYNTQTCSVPTNANVICDEGPGVGLKAIVAKKTGTTRPDEWIMFIGHYDTVPQTIDGAYDNGAGSNFIRYLAKEFANVQTNRSLVFVWYNSEEQGLLASQRHAQYLKNSGQKISAVLGFDMVGIAFPVAPNKSVPQSCMCMFHGADDGAAGRPLLEFVNYDYLGFPGRGSSTSRQARLVGNNTRNSDESSFNNQGFFTLRWAGMRAAGDYPAYHLPDDTIAKIIEVAGGETYYEQGIENTLKSVYYTILALDNHLPVPEATVSSAGLTVSVDASGSSDADAAPTGFSWDFGDGTTAAGATATHRYAAPGTYTVTLTVADNLWSEVTRSKTFTITVD